MTQINKDQVNNHLNRLPFLADVPTNKPAGDPPSEPEKWVTIPEAPDCDPDV